MIDIERTKLTDVTLSRTFSVMGEHAVRGRSGRPPGRYNASFDWARAERLFVSHVPIAQIARELGCSKQNVHRRATRHGWKRGATAADALRSSSPVSSPAEATLETTPDDAEPMQMVNAYLDRFRSALAAGRVRHDAIADLAVAVKLKQLLITEGQTRSTVHGLPPLEQLQELHRANRAKMAEIDAFPAIAGILSSDDSLRPSE